MIRTPQTEFGPRRGNCWSACLSSLLHVPLSEIPDFCARYHPDDGHDEAAWWRETQRWLHARGYELIELDLPDGWDTVRSWPLQPDYWIATGRSPRHDCDHAVVAYRYEIAWDPHPSGDGLDGDPHRGAFFLALEPWRMGRP